LLLLSAAATSRPSLNVATSALHDIVAALWHVEGGRNRAVESAVRPNPAVDTDARRRGFARASVAGYLTL